MKHLHHILLALLAILTMAACADDDSGSKQDSKDVQITFTIALNNVVATRAANEGWDDYDPSDPGTAAERTINTDDLVIAVYNGAGTLLYNIKDIVCTRTTDDATTYSVTGFIPDDAGVDVEAIRKVTVLANSGKPDPDFTALADHTFTLSDATKRYIPMWGVKSFTTALKRGISNDLGQIDMLRALAKIDLALTDEMADLHYTIGTVTLTGYNTTGYTAPAGFTGVSNTTDLRFKNTFKEFRSLPDAANFANNVIDLTGTDGRNSRVTYVPEFDNSNATEAAYLTVQLLHYGEPEGTYTVYFGDYSGTAAPTTYYNIVRNHYYHFEVLKGSAGIEIHVKNTDWSKFTHDDIYM